MTQDKPTNPPPKTIAKVVESYQSDSSYSAFMKALSDLPYTTKTAILFPGIVKLVEFLPEQSITLLSN